LWTFRKKFLSSVCLGRTAFEVGAQISVGLEMEAGFVGVGDIASGRGSLIGKNDDSLSRGFSSRSRAGRDFGSVKVPGLRIGRSIMRHGWKSEEELKEQQYVQLDAALEEAVKQERYGDAARIRDELNALRDDATFAVLSANLQFYAAFDSRNILEMERMWLNDSGVSVIHPFQDVICEFRPVINSYQQIFSGPMSAKITVSDVRVFVRGTTAFVTCKEHLTENSPREGKLTATNVFTYKNSRWYICHHQAGPVLM